MRKVLCCMMSILGLVGASYDLPAVDKKFLVAMGFIDAPLGDTVASIKNETEHMKRSCQKIYNLMLDFVKKIQTAGYLNCEVILKDNHNEVILPIWCLNSDEFKLGRIQGVILYPPTDYETAIFNELMHDIVRHDMLAFLTYFILNSNVDTKSRICIPTPKYLYIRQHVLGRSQIPDFLGQNVINPYYTLLKDCMTNPLTDWKEYSLDCLLLLVDRQPRAKVLGNKDTILFIPRLNPINIMDIFSQFAYNSGLTSLSLTDRLWQFVGYQIKEGMLPNASILSSEIILTLSRQCGFYEYEVFKFLWTHSKSNHSILVIKLSPQKQIRLRKLNPIDQGRVGVMLDEPQLRRRKRIPWIKLLQQVQNLPNIKFFYNCLDYQSLQLNHTLQECADADGKDNIIAIFIPMHANKGEVRLLIKDYITEQGPRSILKKTALIFSDLSTYLTLNTMEKLNHFISDDEQFLSDKITGICIAKFSLHLVPILYALNPAIKPQLDGEIQYHLSKFISEYDLWRMNLEEQIIKFSIFKLLGTLSRCEFNPTMLLLTTNHHDDNRYVKDFSDFILDKIRKREVADARVFIMDYIHMSPEEFIASEYTDQQVMWIQVFTLDKGLSMETKYESDDEVGGIHPGFRRV